MMELEAPAQHQQFIERMTKAWKVGEQKKRIKMQYESSKKEAALKKEEASQKEHEEQVRL